MKTTEQHVREKTYYRNKVHYLLGVLEGAAAGSSDGRFTKLNCIAAAEYEELQAMAVTFAEARV